MNEATILVVDDQPVNREFLSTLLGYAGHRIVEASDGAEALAQAAAEHPQLIISDIVMPTMDGYEFVRQLRVGIGANTPVVFYTSAYHEQEARHLARACGVIDVLMKPSEPEVILAAVEAALNSTCNQQVETPPADFDRTHLRLVTDKLAQKVRELEAANARLNALIQVGRQLASESDPELLLKHLAAATQDILGARFAGAAWIANGSISPESVVPQVPPELIAQLLQQDQPLRVGSLNGPFLGTSIWTGSERCGILYAMDKLWADDFNTEDEQIIVTLAAQAAVAYQNARNYARIQSHATVLKQQYADLTAAHEALKDFSSSVAHDLRAPLRHINAFSRIVMDEAGPHVSDQARDYLGRMNEASLKLGTMIDGLLKLGQLGRQALNRQPASLNSLVREVQAELIQSTAGRNIDWRISQLPSVNCDANLIKVVFVNLLSNALKFTRRQESAVIEVGCAVENGEQVIFIADNGEGFDMRYAENLFQIFQRLHTDEEFEGTGIGLATVHRVIRRHGGRIWASAEGGKGAKFCFTLPPTGESRPSLEGRLPAE